MTLSDLDEILVQLYLRLNGYFTTSLILHSSTWGQNKTEIDSIAIRHPYHKQPDRQIETSDFLNINDQKTDLLICEVKHENNGLLFNEALKGENEAVRRILQWVGLFKDHEINSCSKQVIKLFEDHLLEDDMQNGVGVNNCTIRSLLSCPSIGMDDYNGSKWCLTGTEIFSFANKCLNPDEPRDSCSTRYNFQQWGFPYSQVIRYLKDNIDSNPVDVDKIYEGLVDHLNIDNI